MGDYPQACFPSRIRIFGCALRPMTLGHALVLQYLRSPFAPGVQREREPGLGDVLLGVWVCSQPWERAARRMGSWSARMWLQWMVCLCAIVRANVWYRQLLWVAYIAEANMMPPVWTKKEGGNASGIPELVHVKLSLMGEWHKTEAEALGTPLGQAMWEHCATTEPSGRVRFVNDSERDILGDAWRT